MIRFNNKLVRVNGNLAEIGYVPHELPGPVDPWNPLNLPPYTLRVQLTDTMSDWK